MKTITKSRDCFSCCQCCKFKADETDFAPVFSEIEMNSIPKKYTSQTRFLIKPSKHSFQIQLTPSKKETGLFVCPFYDEEKHLCSIYPYRPLDCQLWPIMLMRNKENTAVDIVCVEPEYCPSVAHISQVEKEKYYAYIVNYLNSPRIQSYIEKYPDIIWSYESGYNKIGEMKLFK